MAEPELANVNLIAATFPGQVGTPPPDDCSVENYARLAAELAAEVRADVVVGFSMGAVVAVEMVTSGAFAGPVVLLGVSLSTKDAWIEAYPDLRVEPVEAKASGDKVFVWLRFSGHGAGSEVPI
jgi:pimeloyl-ACP methyl ester carboxylesterase